MRKEKAYSESIDKFNLFVEEYEEGNDITLFVDLLDSEDVRNISYHLGRLTATIDDIRSLKSWLNSSMKKYLEEIEEEDEIIDDEEEWVYPSEETEELYF